jgi:hypothetical protein
LGILSGRYTASVFILEVEEYNDMEHYKMTELEGFPAPIEIIYPVIYFEAKRM